MNKVKVLFAMSLIFMTSCYEFGQAADSDQIGVDLTNANFDTEVGATVETEPAVLEVRIENNVVYLIQPVLFEFNSATVVFPESEATIQTLADVLDAYPDVDTIINGAFSPEEYSVTLSQRRAQAVAGRLIELGISSERLKPTEWAEFSVVSCGDNEDCYQLSQRVDFFVID